MNSTTDYFEIATDKGLFQKGAAVPDGMVTTGISADRKLVVESYTEAGDWIDISLTGGCTISFHETRIDYILADEPSQEADLREPGQGA
ncbi:hypothetical protein ACH49_01335 [Streptomyces leeuwenhoekii]|uniref:Uncharacterized protein n=1 Tax=Streptomyces leeuwenhoekii TaxID=1437453 RepID=A0ABR5I5E5_STRLW|nr:hypothetical protein [Streptomyces leeuwenhoekii]KMS81802.1 hypothetical protein ACH49_01335 [Streptomyces leeuwenhoekii]